MSTRGSGSGGKADFARGFSLAFEFVGAVFLFWLGGRLLDDRLGTEPWLQVIGALVGWVGGFLHVYYRTKGGNWQDIATTRRTTGASSTSARRGADDAGAGAKDGGAGPDTLADSNAAPRQADGADGRGDGIGGQG